MTEKLKAYLDSLFENVPDTQEVREAKDELYDGMVERYEDCLASGMDEQAAYDCVVDSIGDIRELIDELDTGEGAGGGQGGDDATGKKGFSLDELVQGVADAAKWMVDGAAKTVNGVVGWINDPGAGDVHLVNTIRVPLAGVDTVDIEYITDSVRLCVGEGDELVVNEYMSRADTALFGYTRSQGGTVEVRHGRRMGMFILRSRIEVLLPAAWYGSLNVSTVSGRITSEEHWRFVSMTAKTVSGEIDLAGVSAGMVRATTTSGAVHLAFAEGELDVRTVTGGIRAESVQGGGSFRTTSGSIRVNFEPLAGNVKASTVSGGIRLGIPEDANVELDLKSVSGAVHTAFSEGMSFHSRTRVRARVGKAPYHYVQANSTSGGIHIND